MNDLDPLLLAMKEDARFAHSDDRAKVAPGSGVTVMAIAGADVRAFGDWASQAEPTLRLSLKSFAVTVDVEAVLQETLLRVWQVAPRFVSDGQPNGLLRLGIRIGRNLAVSEARRRKLAPLAELAQQDEAALVGVAPAPPDPLLRKRLAECRDKLPPQPSAALTARLESAGAEADRDLAERLGMMPNTFLQNVTRARKLLLACLEAQGVDLAEELA